MNKTLIFKSYHDFLKRQDESTNGVSEEFAMRFPLYKHMNQTNTACWNCTECRHCNYCADCYGCKNCDYCLECSYCLSAENLTEKNRIIGSKNSGKHRYVNKYTADYQKFCDKTLTPE